MASGVTLLLGGGSVSLPFLEPRHSHAPPLVLLIVVAPAVAFGSARRRVLAHVHLTSARRLLPWFGGAYVLCSASVLLVAVAAPTGLGAATARNGLFVMGVVALGAIVLDQGASWAPLLILVLVMSIFGAEPGDQYASWAVVFEPGASASAWTVAALVWSAGLLAEAVDVQASFDLVRPPAHPGASA